jgi:type IV secretion system protein TrbL
VQMGKAVVDTFGLWGNAAVQAAGGTANMMPMGFLAAGLNLWHALFQAISFGSPFVSAGLIIAGVIDVLIFGWISAQIMLVLIEAFLASYLGSVMIAFGGNSFTRDFATSPVRYAIAVGMKRLTLQFIAGMAEAIVRNFATQVQGVGGGQVGWDDVGVMIVVPIILATLAWIAPKIAQDIIIGSHLSTGAGIIATASTLAGAAVGAVLSAVGMGAAGIAGYQLAGRQTLASTGGATPSTALGRAGSGVAVLGRAATNVAVAAANDVGQRLTGNYQATHGRTGWRIASEMSKQADNLGTSDRGGL